MDEDAPGGGALMATAQDIAQIIKILRTAFPNYHPDPNSTPELLFQLLHDLPTDLLKVAVLETCVQPGRAFAPRVGEIREAVIKLQVRIQNIPDEYEAWGELRDMPKDMLHKTIL